MTRRDKPFTPKKLRIRHTDRMAAAREILRTRIRTLRQKTQARRSTTTMTKPTHYDTLHTDLAKRMREYTEHGTDAVRFLLDVMEDANPDEPYTWHHKMSAAQELLRRGWDTNYDHITPDMLQDYWRNQHSPARPANPPKDHPAQSPFPLRGKVRMGVKRPAEGTGVTAYPASNKPPLPQGEGWGEGESHPTPTTPNTADTAIAGHSHAEPAPSEGRGGNPETQGTGRINTPSPSTNLRRGVRPDAPVEDQTTSSHSFHPCQFPTTTNPTTSSNPSTRRRDGFQLPVANRIRRIRRRRNRHSSAIKGGVEGIQSRPQADKGSRRSRRRPRPPKPPRRHLQAPTHPQPLTNQSLPPQGEG